VSQPLWSKPGTVVDARIMRFLAGDDVLLDRELFVHDLRASAAHAAGLGLIEVLSAGEVAAIQSQLTRLQQAFECGEFVLDARFEDGHSAIEAWLTEHLGEVGRKIHTGRSRNDQVLVASRLWLKERLAELIALTRTCADAALTRAADEADAYLPGYTHLQRAVVSSRGLWWAGWAEGFIDDAQLARDALRLIDANPLGTAAGFGVNLPLPRDAVTEQLGFARLQVNPAAAQLSRGKYERVALGALAAALGDVRRLAWDLSLYTTSEFGFVRLPDEYTTGSSIMPNKRNPDVVELLRASPAITIGAIAELDALLGLPSGYQRDLQYSKAPVLRAMRRGLDALALVPELMRRLTWDEARISAAIEAPMFATDVAIEQALAGVPFRDAYRAAARSEQSLVERTPQASIAARVSPGGCADLRLDLLKERLAAL